MYINENFFFYLIDGVRGESAAAVGALLPPA